MWCQGLWKTSYKVAGLARSTYMLYKWEAQHGCKLHGNEGTKKQRCVTRQTMLNVEAFIICWYKKCANVMFHQIKGIGVGRHDVQLVIPKTWTSVCEWSDEVHKAILTHTYVKTSSMSLNLITFKFMLKVSGKWFWISMCF
jgi:hypothetical protein